LAKTKTPFLSLSAKGSVGESITAQKFHAETLVRGKPYPTDPYSLPQAYQRWLYSEVAWLWSLLTPAEKAAYRSAGARFHLTAFQQYLHERLDKLDYYLGYWKFDNVTAGATLDTTPYGVSGIVYGASPIDGGIGKALYYDGVNDYTNLGTHTHFPGTYNSFSLECLILASVNQRGGIVTRWGSYGYQWFLELTNAGFPRMVIFNNAGAEFAACLGPAALTDGLFHHVAVNWNTNVLLELSIDGTLVASDAAFVGVRSTHVAPLEIGRHEDACFKGIIDNVKLRSRLPVAAQWLEYSKRRYPPE